VQEGEAMVWSIIASSIGVVLFKNHDASPVDILKWADMAMYQAKANGRNVIRFFEG
jgi:diguanylate cyclase (GGDEF)-like protein